MFKGYNKRVSQLQPQWCQRVQKVSAVSDHYPQVENFLMNPTFTSKGGFRIMLNGIRIYQVVKIPTMSSSFCLWLSTPWDQLREKREPNYLKYCIKWFQLMFLNLCNSHCNWSYLRRTAFYHNIKYSQCDQKRMWNWPMSKDPNLNPKGTKIKIQYRLREALPEKNGKKGDIVHWGGGHPQFLN